MERDAVLGAALCAVLATSVYADTGSAGSNWAVQVVSYNPGTGYDPSLTDPTTALGSPERFTGEGTPYAAVVSPFNPPYGTDELVSIGEGGHLTVRFDVPIIDDPADPFGVEFSIFGNAGFIDVDYPNGRLGPVPGAFGLDPMSVEVSSDGIVFESLGTFTEGLFPTLGYLDSGPYDTSPGSIPSDFAKPVDPSLTLADFANLDLAGIKALYDGSGGGTPIDIGGSGLSSIQYVRIANPTGSGISVEIDAFARVPTPASALALSGIAAFVRRRE